jgi:SPX domain protein involved in polyphosphate accumulation/uncharacterized membrane protein YidH (DUF202 family)
VKALEVELAKVENFVRNKLDELSGRASLLTRNLARAKGLAKKAKTLSPQLRVALEALNQEAEEVLETVVRLDGYIRLNATALDKAAKKFDKAAGRSMRDWVRAKLSEPGSFVHADLDSLLVPMSNIFHRLRALLGNDEEAAPPKPKDAGGAVWVPPSSFARDTRKYWIAHGDVMIVKALLVRHLPVLVFGLDTTSDRVINPAEKTKAMATRDSGLITSVYLDNGDLESYQTRLRKEEGARLIRVRWYGEDDFPTPEVECFVEQKTHHESWSEEKSVKERFHLRARMVGSFLQGNLTPVTAHQKSMAAAGAISEKEMEEQLRLAEDVSTFIQEHKLAPMTRTRYRRTAFQRPDTNKVRVSLDTDLAVFVDQADAAKPLHWWARRDYSSSVSSPTFAGGSTSSLPLGDRFVLPMAVMEIKLSGVETEPSWISQLKTSGLIHECGKFSKFGSSIALLFPDRVPFFPHWFSEGGKLADIPSVGDASDGLPSYMGAVAHDSARTAARHALLHGQMDWDGFGSDSEGEGEEAFLAAALEPAEPESKSTVATLEELFGGHMTKRVAGTSGALLRAAESHREPSRVAETSGAAASKSEGDPPASVADVVVSSVDEPASSTSVMATARDAASSGAAPPPLASSPPPPSGGGEIELSSGIPRQRPSSGREDERLIVPGASERLTTGGTTPPSRPAARSRSACCSGRSSLQHQCCPWVFCQCCPQGCRSQANEWGASCAYSFDWLIPALCFQAMGCTPDPTLEGLAGKRRLTPMKVEPKSILALERTLIQWISASLFLMSFAAVLLPLGGAARFMGFVLTPTAVVFLLYAIWIYMSRSRAMKEKRADFQYELKAGPCVLVSILIVILVLSFIDSIVPFLGLTLTTLPLPIQVSTVSSPQCFSLVPDVSALPANAADMTSPLTSAAIGSGMLLVTTPFALGISQVGSGTSTQASAWLTSSTYAAASIEPLQGVSALSPDGNVATIAQFVGASATRDRVVGVTFNHTSLGFSDKRLDVSSLVDLADSSLGLSSTAADKTVRAVTVTDVATASTACDVSLAVMTNRMVAILSVPANLLWANRDGCGGGGSSASLVRAAVLQRDILSQSKPFGVLESMVTSGANPDLGKWMVVGASPGRSAQRFVVTLAAVGARVGNIALEVDARSFTVETAKAFARGTTLVTTVSRGPENHDVVAFTGHPSSVWMVERSADGWSGCM